jgi:hypothetical protein
MRGQVPAKALLLVKKVAFDLCPTMLLRRIFLISCQRHQIILQAAKVFFDRDYVVRRTRVLVAGMDPMGLDLLLGLRSLVGPCTWPPHSEEVYFPSTMLDQY